VVCFAWEQAFSPVLHEVIVSELQSPSGSGAGSVHAEALMWLLLLFWDPAVPVLDCSNVDNSREKSGNQNMRSGSETERDYRTLHREKKERGQKKKKPAASKSCPAAVAMPRAKQAFYQFLGFRFILVSGISASQINAWYSLWGRRKYMEHLLANRPIDSRRSRIKAMKSVF